MDTRTTRNLEAGVDLPRTSVAQRSQVQILPPQPSFVADLEKPSSNTAIVAGAVLCEKRSRSEKEQSRDRERSPHVHSFD